MPKIKKQYKFKKGDVVSCSAFVFTQYEANLSPMIYDDMKIIHTPPEQYKNRKVLVRSELAKDWKHPFLIVGVKHIQTGYYDAARAPSSTWGGYDEGEPATFTADKYHDVYVLESMLTQRWMKLNYAIEEDLKEYK